MLAGHGDIGGDDHKADSACEDGSVSSHGSLPGRGGNNDDQGKVLDSDTEAAISNDRLLSLVAGGDSDARIAKERQAEAVGMRVDRQAAGTENDEKQAVESEQHEAKVGADSDWVSMQTAEIGMRVGRQAAGTENDEKQEVESEQHEAKVGADSDCAKVGADSDCVSMQTAEIDEEQTSQAVEAARRSDSKNADADDQAASSSKQFSEQERERLEEHLESLRGALAKATVEYGRLCRKLNSKEVTDREEIEEYEQMKSSMDALEKASRGKINIHHQNSNRLRAERIRHYLKHKTRIALAEDMAAMATELQRTASMHWLMAKSKQDGGFRWVTNPKCINMNESLAEEEPERTLSRELLHINCDLEEEEEEEEEEEDSSEPFFLLAENIPRYQATAAKLYLEIDSIVKEVEAIIDSGAAWCAIDLNLLRRLFPKAAVQKTSKQFKDASGNTMRLRGVVHLAFNVGDLKLDTPVFVFEGLGAPFLLGTNAMDTHHLSLSYHRKVMFSEHPEKATPRSTVPIAVQRCERAVEHVAFAGLLDLHKEQKRCEDEDIHPQSDSCNCGTREGVQMICSIREGKLKCVTADGRVYNEQAYAIQPTDVTGAGRPKQPRDQGMELLLSRDVVLKPGKVQDVWLEYREYIGGTSLDKVDVELDESFCKSYGAGYSATDCIQTYQGMRVNLMNAHVQMHLRCNSTDSTNRKVRIPRGTCMARARHKSKAHQEDAGEDDAAAALLGSVRPSNASDLALRVMEERSASKLKWKCVGTEPPMTTVQCFDGWCTIPQHRPLADEKLAALLASRQELGEEELRSVKWPKDLLLSHCVKATDGKYYMPSEELPFEQGGRPTKHAHLQELGFSLDKSIDPSKPKGTDGHYPPLDDEKKAKLYDVALQYWYVWARDPRVPKLSRLIMIDVPTGDAEPASSKPYPIPYQYLPAVRKEIQSLLDAGLIEPCISNWASPVLVRLKKDSTPENIKLKCILDVRKLNERTVPDVASIGDQEEILDGFGGDQRWCGIADAAGGFYQLLVSPSSRHKVSMVLPSSMGGTQFQWVVAPYGLTRCPAGYSRAMMFALGGLDEITVEGGTAGAKSWIDDVSMHASSFEGFLHLFTCILQRFAAASMSMKASKTLLLHERLEVLGYFITPDGLVMQDDKLKEFASYRKEVKNGEEVRVVVGPSSIEEIRKFLGAVQFYRRFVPRLAMLAAPMNAMLKKMPKDDPRLKEGTPEHKQAWAGVQESYEAILAMMSSKSMVSAPDLKDPLAEYVICTDACNMAAGGALLQWQWRKPGPSPGPPAGTPMRGEKGSDPIQQSWRIAAGWELRVIGYYSKTFDVAQKNYATFDQESAAILLCCRKWAKLITGRPTTVYTDSVVAASMLTKHLGPPRLQRWGIELGTFLPYLKIAFRKGESNGLADFLSRYPTFEKYVTRPEGVAQLPDETLIDICEVPLFTHELSDEREQQAFGGWKYTIAEAKEPEELESIWQAHSAYEAAGKDSADAELLAFTQYEEPSRAVTLPSIADRTREAVIHTDLPGMIAALRETVTRQEFWQEQKEFDRYVEHWENYASAHRETTGVSPVLYDLCCGEGGYSRGARVTGCKCIGFDNADKCRARYEQEPTASGVKVPSGMKFVHADVLTEDFWEDLKANSKGLPLPDVLHVSPSCVLHSKLKHIPGGAQSDQETIDWLILKLRDYERHLREQHSRHLVWQIENVTDSEQAVGDGLVHVTRLCGTMMGHQTFRHRTFFSNYPLRVELPHSHEGKLVGSRKVRFANDHARFAHQPAPNMYGIYSKPYAARGSAEEWHGALGAMPRTYSVRGLANALPMGYGRLTAGQMVAYAMHRTYGMPVWTKTELGTHEAEMLKQWAKHGYQSMLRASSTVQREAMMAMRTHSGDKNKESGKDKNKESDKSKNKEPDKNKNKESDEDQSSQLPPEASFGEGEHWQGKMYRVTRERQLADPLLGPKLRALEELPAGLSKRFMRRWVVKDGMLRRVTFSEDGELRYLMAVPAEGQTALMAQYHYVNHRGHQPLVEQLQQSYYWPRMHEACVDFVGTCSKCAPLTSRPMTKVPSEPRDTPCRPFATIHVDHKGPLKRSGAGKFQHIMVVTCALTRFTLLIPVQTVSGDETLRMLVSRVFSVFGNPSCVVTDNGPAFVSDLLDAASSFYGYRHMHILPYNAQANGIAESAVKKIKLLLDRMTDGYDDWHRLLPMSQQLLNCTTHTGLGVTPYFALFGREPDGLEKLENPELYPTTNGHELLSEIRGKLLYVHRHLKQHSDDIKAARALEEREREYSRLRTSRHGKILPSTPAEDRYVWLLYGSFEQAAYLRKHGHGTPWKHKYKVLEVKPHAIRLEVPSDGSVPRVQEWQLIRKAVSAKPGEHEPPPDTPQLTEKGILLNPSRKPKVYDPSELWEIEEVSHAVKVGNRYQIWIKWKDSDELTWEWRSDLVNQGDLNDELLSDIEKEVEKERTRLRSQHYMYDDEEPEPPAPEEPTRYSAHGRPVRNRSKPDRHSALLVVEGETYGGAPLMSILDWSLWMERGEGACGEHEF